jgi:serine/threonine protein kinase
LGDGFLPWVAGGLAPGTLIAGYQIMERVGQGGMAVVFRARDERLNRQVALKVLAPGLAADVAFRQRFIRESQVAATVDDPNIIPVYDAGEADGVLFIAMRLVRGGDVKSLVTSEGFLPPARVEWIVSAVASALDSAHDQGLVHRDVKPHNMLLEARRGRPDHVYLSDFGLSKMSVGSSGLTGSGQFLGTVDYCSPEQIQGKQVDGRTDQYALGCTAFELLTGDAPFARDHAMAVMWAHITEDPPAVSSRRTGLPAAADDVFAKVLAKEPTERYGSCQEFADALRHALGVPSYAVGAQARAAPHAVEEQVVQKAPDRRADPGSLPGSLGWLPNENEASPEQAADIRSVSAADGLPMTIARAPAGETSGDAPDGSGLAASKGRRRRGRRATARALGGERPSADGGLAAIAAVSNSEHNVAPGDDAGAVVPDPVAVLSHGADGSTSLPLQPTDGISALPAHPPYPSHPSHPSYRSDETTNVRTIKVPEDVQALSGLADSEADRPAASEADQPAEARRPRRLARMILIGIVVAAVLAAGGTIVALLVTKAPSGQLAPLSVSEAFPPEHVRAGVVAVRHWDLGGTAGSVLTEQVTLTNSTAIAQTLTFKEPVPAAIAPSLSAVHFTPPVAGYADAGRVAVWMLKLSAHERIKVGYWVRVPAKGARMARLAAWTNDFRALAAGLTPQHTVSRLRSLAIEPRRLKFPAGSTARLTASGVLSDGKGAPASYVADITWTSAKPRIATIDAFGKVTGKSQGTTKITARVGVVTASIRVVVTRVLSPSPSPTSYTAPTYTPPSSSYTPPATHSSSPIPTVTPPPLDLPASQAALAHVIRVATDRCARYAPGWASDWTPSRADRGTLCSRRGPVIIRPDVSVLFSLLLLMA